MTKLRNTLLFFYNKKYMLLFLYYICHAIVIVQMSYPAVLHSIRLEGSTPHSHFIVSYKGISIKKKLIASSSPLFL